MARKKDNKPAPPPLLPMPAVCEPLKPLADEIHRIHESVAWSAQTQFEQLKLWRGMNMILGVPAAS
jgi:hypothetical protein